MELCGLRAKVVLSYREDCSQLKPFFKKGGGPFGLGLGGTSYSRKKVQPRNALVAGRLLGDWGDTLCLKKCPWESEKFSGGHSGLKALSLTWGKCSLHSTFGGPQGPYMPGQYLRRSVKGSLRLDKIPGPGKRGKERDLYSLSRGLSENLCRD